MAIVSIFTRKELAVGGSVALDRVRYLINVMRRGLGDRIRLVNGSGKEFIGTITKITKHLVEVTSIECSREDRANSFLGLIFPPIGKLEALVKMATELGVTSFLPFRGQHGQVKYNRSRIEKNVIEAVEQSERLDFPEIGDERSLVGVLEEIDPSNDVVLLCRERSEPNSGFFSLEDSIRNKKTYALVGPEGGFSGDEIKLLKNYPFVISLSLGKNILRTETASASIISIINYCRRFQ
ncbi:MAG: 16S rRNA (uracil(1498)-N(3))-methyltransferase [Rickettsiales bacterium]|nr:16S rRNA (uracil(1498)-N(3))-methyltransferase [Rickettsiales bacterium]